MCKDLTELKKILEDHSVRNRPIQITAPKCAQIAHQLSPYTEGNIKPLLVDLVNFFNEEYGCATASALDGDPLERGKVRELRDQVCNLIGAMDKAL